MGKLYSCASDPLNLPSAFWFSRNQFIAFSTVLPNSGDPGVSLCARYVSRASEVVAGFVRPHVPSSCWFFLSHRNARITEVSLPGGALWVMSAAVRFGPLGPTLVGIRNLIGDRVFIMATSLTLGCSVVVLSASGSS